MDFFVVLLSIAGVYFFFKLIEFRNEQYQKMIDKKTGKIKTTRQRLLELEEEVFLKHNITYDSRLEKSLILLLPLIQCLIIPIKLKCIIWR